MNPRTSAGRNKLAGVIAEKTVRRVRVPEGGTYRVRQARDKTWTRPPECVVGERTPGVPCVLERRGYTAAYESAVVKPWSGRNFVSVRRGPSGARARSGEEDLEVPGNESTGSTRVHLWMLPAARRTGRGRVTHVALLAASNTLRMNETA